MFKPNFLVLSRIFIILVGMIKAGYSFMLMSNYTNTLFYKYTGTFFAGYILTLSFYKLISRNLILLFAEFLYILMMIIIPFSSNDFRIYGYLFSGGFCFLLYPFYFNENLLKCDQRKSTILSWIFMGLGAIYFFWLTYHYQPKYNFDTNVWTILNILSQSDEITPYVFGSFSVLNILLIIFQKGKETISFYRLKQDKEKIVELSSFLYKKTYIDKIEQEFNIDDVESTNSLLLYDNNNQNEINKKENGGISQYLFDQ
ncbi:transmembrane protein, putative (macronuclear) [Tetrahymena thermophila SB210]|uniref:Transmembrane protein, putative n=1 Tax=Tetrahymena thermophila (strain SB210) TaxID=312017 RepID=I7MIM6_TETTS|nr:transmembrane protein, putative [Tetrahymena thermophila SB210]EAR93853.2 transmembrane protein, putative [Tetrahymena thermophila SB210]|eukprot:XP_001014098.2 transmembrane protein, putative [Tetrahymena thermophila SB210]